MTYQEKLDWLREIFSNDPGIRAEAMSAPVSAYTAPLYQRPCISLHSAPVSAPCEAGKKQERKSEVGNA